MKKIYLILAAPLLWLLSLGYAHALGTGWLENPQHPPVKVRLMLTGQQDIQAKTVEALLEVQLDGEWKTYWRSPGEGGIAPEASWDESSNLKKVDWFWPMPKRYPQLGLETIGYKEHATFPLTLHLQDMSQPVTLRGKLTLSSCTNVCVLTDYTLSLNFTPAELTINQQAMHLYNQGQSTVPKANDLVVVDQLGWDESKQKVLLKATYLGGWKKPQLFVFGDEDVSFGKPVFTLDGNKLTALVPASSWLGKVALLDKSLLLTFGDENLASEVSARVTVAKITEEEAGIGLIEILVIALLGGLILNVMPCVLPVLGLKLSSIVTAKGATKSQIRGQFLASAAGILVSFWILAGFLIMLKLSGQALGWGVQFQSPWFIGLMTLVTGLFAVNMLGLFEIRIPPSIQTWLACKGDNSYVGHFIQGMFATLLATPCSAPFLGTAVAYALGADVITLLSIFTALALGMALPWLLIALFPKLAVSMPKPGRWMSWVKTFFALLMLATTAWLLSLMTSFISVAVVWGIALGLGLLMLVRLGQVYGKKALLVSAASLLFLTGAGFITASLTSNQWATPLPADLEWTRLNTAEITKQVAQGKTVFVDVTADWCISCKANKVGVLLQDPVYQALQGPNMLTMKGDWTLPSAEITDYLQSYNRFGVPFNIVYGPNAPHGIELPVILSSEAVMTAIKQASGN